MQTGAARRRVDRQATRHAARALIWGRAAVALTLLALACAVPGAEATVAPVRCAGTRLRPTDTNLARVRAATVCLIDRARRAAHLEALRSNRSLQSVAVGQSLEMVLGDYFGGDSRSGATPMRRIVATRYPAHSVSISTAQNIGWGTGTDATPAEMVDAWMRSPAHREIILTQEFREIGVGIAPAAPAVLAGGRPGATYAVEFGARHHR